MSLLYSCVYNKISVLRPRHAVQSYISFSLVFNMLSRSFWDATLNRDWPVDQSSGEIFFQPTMFHSGLPLLHCRDTFWHLVSSLSVTNHHCHRPFRQPFWRLTTPFESESPIWSVPERAALDTLSRAHTCHLSLQRSNQRAAACNRAWERVLPSFWPLYRCLYNIISAVRPGHAVQACVSHFSGIQQ